MMAQRFKRGKLQALRKQQQELEIKPKLHILNKYEKLIGLKEVQVAQMAVRQQEKMLMETIQERQTVIEKLLDTQRRIKAVHTELGKFVRGEESLITEQRQAETREREAMASLSESIRESQET